jgi:alkylation response protein AidB-like acyl-CoA dehydrogenase
MDFGHSPGEERFRARVRSALVSPRILLEIARLRACGGEPDERPLYRMLGTAGLLAPAWPADYGGQGCAAVTAAILLEELITAGVPDTLYVNGLQTVGQLVLATGTEEQRARFLPPLARGECFATVLYTEPDAGSDLSALTTSARPAGDGFELSGTKMYSLKAQLADVGLCAARTATTTSRYAGITLFLVDLHAPGVRVRTVPSVPDEQFHVVELDQVRVGGDAVLGGVGEGWAALAQALPFERTGLEFASRAQLWYTLGCSGDDRPAWLEHIGRYGARAEAARLLAWRAASHVAAGQLDPLPTSIAKWYCSELAAELAGWVLQRHGLGAPADVVAEAGRAYREAPGLTLSGGSSEMMLRLVSGYLLSSAVAEE